MPLSPDGAAAILGVSRGTVRRLLRTGQRLGQQFRNLGEVISRVGEKGVNAVAITKEELYRLIDELPEQEAPAAKRYLQFLIHPPVEKKKALAEHLADPEYDDEPWTEEDEAARKEALKDIAAGRIKPLEQVAREFGFR